MKNRLLLLLFPILLFGASCTKNDQQVVPTNQTVFATVNSSNWSTSDGGKTYYTYINMPEIDSYQNQYGAVLVYATYDGGTTYEAIPEVYNGIAYSFTHSVGRVEIDLQSSTSTSTITPPGGVGIKIVLIPSSL